MRLGTGRAIITPPLGTRLAGYGHRDHGAEGVLDDLEVRALWFQDGGSAADAVLLITADLIGFGAALTDGIRHSLETAFGVKAHRVLLAASHTHSGPQAVENLSAAGGEPEATVTAMLSEQILAAVAAARHELRPVRLTAARGRCEGYAINRRVLIDGRAIMAANPDGVRDDTVTVIACHDAVDGSARAVLFHFTCHPTVMGDYRITADYPGAARRHIERALANGAVAAFLPGCFGDVRPNCTLIGGKRFRRGLPEDVALFGEALGNEVLRILRDEMQPLTPRLGGRSTVVELPLTCTPATRPLTLQRLDLAAEALLVAMGGEICCDYGLFVKSLRPDAFLLPLGYSNGLVGYISPARYFPEGGYEPDTSHPYFGLPAPFSPDIERIIQSAIADLLGTIEEER